MSSNIDFRTLYNDVKDRYAEHNAVYINGRYFTYAEVDGLVRKFMSVFEQEGLLGGPCTIAVSEEQSIYAFAAIIAVFLTGQTLVPFNCSYPVERNRYLFEKTKPQLIISGNRDHRIEKIVSGVADLDCSWFTYSEQSFAKKRDHYHFHDGFSNVAYILLTSGSTGKPKGVPVSYKNLNHCLGYFYRNYNFNQTDRFLQVYNTTFDVFYFSFLMPLCVGACCYFIDLNNSRTKYLQIFQALEMHQISVVSMVPTILLFVEKYLKEFHFPDVRYSFFSGDALLHSIAKKWERCLPNGVIHNFYGPTETTIVCTRYLWNEERSETESYHDVVPLGQPFLGMECLIVNDANQPVNGNEIGELAFSGAQVIDSYVDQGFEDRFFKDDLSGKVFYKTGDLAFVNQENNLVFVGRKDFQYKINGYRIELAEVEASITEVVKGPCMTIVEKGSSGLNSMYAFVLSNSLEEKEIFAVLKDKLPAYMLPKRIIHLDNFPINENGKIDRLELKKIINSK